MTRRSRALALAAALSLSVAGVAAAAATGDIVDTSYVRQALAHGAILWDVRTAADYRAGHIAGAVNIGSVYDALQGPNREAAMPAAVADTVFGNAGIDLAGREVIAYGRQGHASAHYALSLMRYYGARQARVFHGGLDEWKAGGGAVDTLPTRLMPVALRLKPAPDVLVWTPDVVAALGKSGVQIVDVRSPDEYTGKDLRAVRGGHVPGAIPIPYEQSWTDPETAVKLQRKETESRGGMALKPETDLRRTYAGLDPGKETIVYCQSGARASVTADVLRSLGFRRVRVYKPSWSGYAAALDAPADNEVFYNFGAVEDRITSLQSRIARLEAQVDSLRGAAPAE